MRQTIDEPKRSKTPYVLGCCGGGCLLAVLAVIGIAMWFTSFINSLQEPTPTVELNPVNQELFESTETRYVEYKNRVDTGEALPSDEFVLTEEEINNAISNFLGDGEDAPRVRVTLNGDIATGEVSFPVPKEDGTTKWVNGEAEFTVELADDLLDIRLKRLKVRGKDIPDSFMEGLRSENLAKDLNNDPEFRKEIKNIESIELKDSKVHVKLKSAQK